MTVINRGTRVTRATEALPQTNTKSLFTVAGGKVLVTSIVGEVTAQIGAVANATKLTVVPTAGPLADLCATTDITGDVIGTLYSITGTVATAMLTDGAVQSLVGGVVVNTGSINVDCAGNDGGAGRVSWVLTYVPLDAGATVVVTP